MPKTLPMIDMSAPVCCAPVAAGPMSDDDALHVALRLKALADPARVKIMSIAVGTALSSGPPHRSQRAELPHWAPASDSGVEPHVRKGMPLAGGR